MKNVEERQFPPKGDSMNRRDVLKLSLAAGGAGVLAQSAQAQDGREKGAELLKYLWPPDGFPDQRVVVCTAATQ